MSSQQVFSAPLEKDDNTEGTGVRMPFDVSTVFGTRGRVPVRGTINGAPFRTTLAPYGGAHLLPVNKQLREAAQARAGDTVNIVLERDVEERVVEVPQDLQSALDEDPALLTAWNRLSYTHRKEHVRALHDAKKPETRQRRLEGTIRKLQDDAG